MKIRQANKNDFDLFESLINRPNMVRGEINLHDWFMGNFQSHYVIEVEGNPIGIFRLEDIVEVSIAIKPGYCGKGIGSKIIDDLKKIKKPKVAFIHSENKGSKNFAVKTGFVKEGFEAYRLN